MNNSAIKNPLHKMSWRLDIPDNGKTISFQLQAQETMLPGFMLSTATAALNPMLQGTIPGSGVSFDPLSVRVLLDEEMQVYTDLLEWALRTTDWMHNQCQSKAEEPRFLLIHIIDNMSKNIMCTFKYVEPFPISVGSVDMSYIEDGNMPVAMDVQIGYKWYEVIRGDKVISTRRLPATPSRNGPSLHPRAR